MPIIKNGIELRLGGFNERPIQRNVFLSGMTNSFYDVQVLSGKSYSQVKLEEVKNQADATLPLETSSKI